MFSHDNHATASSRKGKDGKGDRVMIAKIASKLEAMDKKLASMGLQDGKKGHEITCNPNHEPVEEESVKGDTVTRVMYTRVKRHWYKRTR